MSSSRDAEPQLFDTAHIERLLDKEVGRLRVSSPRSALDQIRPLYGWTVFKLDVLRIYLTLYRRVAGNSTYIDGFAGDGRIAYDGALRPGSVAVALDAKAFKRLLLYERPRTAKRLQEWLAHTRTTNNARRCTVRSGDFNRLVAADLNPALVPPDKPCFAFLDPNSTQLDWATVERLAAYKADCAPPRTCKIELFVLFNTHQALMRLMPTSGQPPDARTLDRWMGHGAWQDLFDAGAGPAAFARRYAERLVDLGYGAAQPFPIRDPRTRRIAYYMIHASDHPAAHGFMRYAANKAGEEHFDKLVLPGL